MDPAAHARYNRNMALLTGSATWLAPLGLTRLANMPASVVLDKLPVAERSAARQMALQSKNYRALHTEYLGIDPALEVARHLPPVPRVPTVVLSTNALSEFPPGWEQDAMRQHWIAGQRALARQTDAKQVVVADAGHYVQLERPELVLAAVHKVVRRWPPVPAPTCARTRHDRPCSRPRTNNSCALLYKPLPAATWWRWPAC